MLQTKTESKPGMASNVALNVKTLGHKATIVSNTTEIIKERFLDERFSQQVLRVDSNDTCASLDPNDVVRILNEKEFDGTIISDYNKGFLPHSVLSKIIPLLPRPIFVDSKKKDLSAYNECILKINKLERETVSVLPSSCDLITTLGDQGAKWRGKIYPAQKIHDVFDVCGAGDSFLAALSVKFIETNDMIKSIKFANICAGISVRHMGVYNVTLMDIEKTQGYLT
jgi:D-beta-D-heptose 7-phosphate kinase/D-beta-D-heptose 1-phosphate adenosyltransferase